MVHETDGPTRRLTLGNDYYVFATPGMFLLGEDMVIIKKPVSIAHLEAIVDYMLE